MSPYHGTEIFGTFFLTNTHTHFSTYLFCHQENSHKTLIYHCVKSCAKGKSVVPHFCLCHHVKHCCVSHARTYRKRNGNHVTLAQAKSIFVGPTKMIYFHKRSVGNGIETGKQTNNENENETFAMAHDMKHSFYS